MMLFRNILITVSCLLLPGCAGYLNAWTNDPFQHQAVKGPTIYTMTGDRRTTVFNDRNSSMKYCAESLPDAVAAVAASSSASLSAQGLEGGAGGEAKMSDATTISLLQTFRRTEIAELSRQLGWSTCLAWAQGAIDNAQYHAILQDIISGSLEVMKTRAQQSLIAAPPAEKAKPDIKDEHKSNAKADPKADARPIVVTVQQ